jgi:glycosyltransferase involved in cell wall biosynthesis
MKNGRIKVLHITPHLGGGVGKALSGLVLNTPSDSNICHSIVCLETPEKMQFIDKVIKNGCNVFLSPSNSQLSNLIENSDIVQLEWWNHPETISRLCRSPLPAMRLLIWCHVSGLHNPIIPKHLIESAHKCIFTSPCSYSATEVSSLLPAHKNRMDVVHSAGGFEELVLPDRSTNDPLVMGYFGSLNFAKLHPHYVDYLAAVTLPNFKVRLIGDIHNKDILEKQCEQADRLGMLDFRGYSTRISSELQSINVLAYLLNPEHYGTTENALLEAMAMGIVPIVLDNPAERYLVEDRKTGLIVSNPGEFAAAVLWLAENPKERQKISRQAVEAVQARFNVDRMVTSLTEHYCALTSEQKRTISFTDIFGKSPSDWFLSCQWNPSIFTEALSIDFDEDVFATYGLLEQTKGTVFHFLQNFPDDLKLKQWADSLTSKIRQSTKNSFLPTGR